MIQKYKLYYDKKKAAKLRTKRAKNRGAKKIRIHQVNPKDFITKEKPFFFCIDTIVLYLPWGIKRYIFTAVEYFHKLSYAKAYKTKAAKNAFDFLLRLLVLTENKVAAILIDNGSEFKKEFEAACKKLKIVQVFTRLKTPKDNSINGRYYSASVNDVPVEYKKLILVISFCKISFLWPRSPPKEEVFKSSKSTKER